MGTIKTTFGLLLLAFVTFTFVSCDGTKDKKGGKNISAATPPAAFGKDTIFHTDNLILVRLSPHVFQHISYLETNDFGRVSCNGMVVLNAKQAVVFDTPTNNESSDELINFLTQKLKSKIIAVIPTHFHEDCVGGMQTFNLYQIPAYASNLTLAYLKNTGNKNAALIKGFDDSLTLKVGEEKVTARYHGEGHTKDNITGYYPADNILFGGCLVKELKADKGFLGDANVESWPATIAKIKSEYPQAKIVIPGHGQSGGLDLLDYTRALFQ